MLLECPASTFALDKLGAWPGVTSLEGKNSIVDFAEFDVNRVIANRQEIEKHIPQRFEMAQLDGVLFEDVQTRTAVGYKDITPDEFWVRGHMPDFPLMPGVIMCESAAQLIAYLGGKHGYKDDGIVGFGGLNNVRFRNMVVPGDKLIVMVHVRKLRRNVMVICDFQGFVDQKLVVDGEIRGVVLPADTLTGVNRQTQ